MWTEDDRKKFLNILDGVICGWCRIRFSKKYGQPRICFVCMELCNNEDSLKKQNKKRKLLFKKYGNLVAPSDVYGGESGKAVKCKHLTWQGFPDTMGSGLSEEYTTKWSWACSKIREEGEKCLQQIYSCPLSCKHFVKLNRDKLKLKKVKMVKKLRW